MACAFFFFFNDTATTEIYTLSLHDALPISHRRDELGALGGVDPVLDRHHDRAALELRILGQHRSSRDRKSTRLNSSHLGISYAVFCLKKKKNTPDISGLRPQDTKPKRHEVY